MGFQLVRRDAAVLCVKTMKTYFDYIFSIKDKEKAAESIKVMMTDLLGEYLSLGDFVITKKIAKAEYKTTPPHVHAWRRMRDRVGITEAPAIGERFEFVVTKMNKKMGRGLPEAIIDLPLAKEIGFENLTLDKEYYHETFIFNPMKKIMALIHGEKLASKILSFKQYEVKETITATPGNLLGFLGKKKIVSKKRYRGLGFDDKFLEEIRIKRAKDGDDEKWDIMGDRSAVDDLVQDVTDMGN
jgi:DNA polymerase elongation subunit (family B)